MIGFTVFGTEMYITDAYSSVCFFHLSLFDVKKPQLFRLYRTTEKPADYLDQAAIFMDEIA